MPDFKSSPEGALLFLDEVPPSSLGGAYSVAFLPDAADQGPLTVEESWSTHPGVFLFLNAAPADLRQTALIASVRVLLDDPAWRNTRMLWIANPVDPLARWRVDGLALARHTDAVTAAVDRAIVDRATFFDFRNLSLAVAQGGQAALTGEEVVITQSGGFRLLRAGGEHLRGIGDTLRIPLAGDFAGCLQFDLTLPLPDAAKPYRDLIGLDASMQMFVKDASFPVDDADFFVAPLRYPLLTEIPETGLGYSAALSLQVSLDPLNPLDGVRTSFALEKPTGEDPSLPSCFRTSLGRNIRLTPQDTQSRLVFADAPTASRPKPGDAFYLTPAGSFAVKVAPSADGSVPSRPDRNLLCGLSGVEFLKIDPATSHLSFVPGRNAFAPGFGDAAGSDAVSTGELLTPLATTSWTYMRQDNGAAPIYYAQPDDAVFYTPFADATDTGELLEALELPSVPLPQNNAGDSPAFPMLPYGGVQGDSVETYRLLEGGIVSPVRRRSIHDVYEVFRNRTIPAGSTEARDLLLKPEAADKAATTLTAVTPQGLLANFSGDFETWRKLILGTDKSGHQLMLRNIPRGAPIRDALVSNKLFLVVSDAAQLRDYLTAGGETLTIAGWGFDLAPQLWANHGTLLIFKSFDKPLQDLVEQTALWTLHETFNPQLEATQATLARLLRDAVAKGGPGGTPDDQEKYGALFQIATDETWSGILALNLNVAPDSFPPSLKALSSGIKAENFFAQYLAIDTSSVHRQGTELQSDASSLSGLIDYVSDSAPFPTVSGYNFEVTKLTAVFKNSLLDFFAAEVAVTLDLLFEEDTSLIGATNNRNILLLAGTAESHDGVDTYSFAFSGDNRFGLPASGVFEEVEMLQASFSTDPSDAPEGWTAPEAGLAAGGASVSIGGGENSPRAGDKFTVEGDTQVYTVSGFAASTLTFSPAAANGIPGSAPLNFDSTVNARFQFSGNLIFRSASAATTGTAPAQVFDVLSFGPADTAPSAKRGLRFSNLLVHLSFLESKPGDRTFQFDPANLTLDLQKSSVRPQSLYAKFPLELTALLHKKDGTTPATLGFLDVKTPLGGESPAANWYGLTFNLQLGTVGALAGKAGLVVSILAAWTPRATGKGVFVGLKLPGAGAGKEFNVQGVIKIVFKSIQFLVNDENPGGAPRYSYILKLKNLMLKFLVLSLPPKAQTEIVIFGNPKGTVDDRTLGWFAAYQKGGSGTP